jgi:hypothetical protein
MANSANAYVIHPKDPGSNLGTDRKYFHNLLKTLNHSMYMERDHLKM